MAITSNDLFTSGQILTAQECNQFPFGIVAQGAGGVQSTTGTGFETFISATGTVLANRSIKITVIIQAYGYVGGFNMQVLEGATAKFSAFSIIAASANATPYVYTFVYTPSSAGSKTWNVQLQRVGGTNVSIYADSTILNQLIVEDVGTA
jgi:hypothetical protein